MGILYHNVNKKKYCKRAVALVQKKEEKIINSPFTGSILHSLCIHILYEVKAFLIEPQRQLHCREL